MLYGNSGLEVIESGLEGDIWIKELDFELRMIKSRKDSLKAYSLRHKIFAEELKWVPTTPDGLEIDEYDEYAVQFGVFNREDELCAYMRVILPGHPFMMEKEFMHLVSPEHKIRKALDTAEISRLCVDPQARTDMVSGNFGMHSTTVLILKGVYHWSLHNGVDHIYAETEEKVYRLFRLKGFTWKAIGAPVTMPDGVKAVAIHLSWSEFIETNSKKRPEFLEWFNQVQSVPGPRLLPRHESDLQHPVFV